MNLISHWWKHLGYCWNTKQDEFKTFGIRPWRGAPFLWFCIDSSNTAMQTDKHRAECEECLNNPETKREENVMPSVDIAQMAEELATYRALAKSQGELALDYKARLNELGASVGAEIQTARLNALEEAENICRKIAEPNDSPYHYAADNCANAIEDLKNKDNKENEDYLGM